MKTLGFFGLLLFALVILGPALSVQSVPSPALAQAEVPIEAIGETSTDVSVNPSTEATRSTDQTQIELFFNQPDSPTPPLTQRPNTSMIVIHHSATDTGDANSFRKHHVEKNGWDDIGYHAVITPDGTCQIGRHIDAIGAHAGSRDPLKRNRYSIGICLVGTDSFSQAQLATLAQLVTELCQRYGIQPNQDTIVAHHEECPGHGLDLQSLIAAVQ